MSSFDAVPGLPSGEPATTEDVLALVYEIRDNRHVGLTDARQPHKLRTILDSVTEANQKKCNFIDAQRCLGWASPVLSEVYQFELDFFNWAQMASQSASEALGPQNCEMDKVWKCRDYGDALQITFGFDALKLLPPSSLTRVERRRAVMRLATNDSVGFVFKRRFACGIRFYKSRQPFSHPGSVVFITDTPAIAGLPYLAYQVWSQQVSLFDFIQDIFIMLVSDLKVILDQARRQLTIIETEVVRDPTNAAHIKCLLRTSQNCEMIRSESNTLRYFLLLLSRSIPIVTQKEEVDSTSSIQNPTSPDDLNPSAIFSDELTELTFLLESIDRDLIRRTKSLMETSQTLSMLNEAKVAVDQAESIRRISWVTFIFLPLLFVASLFGMNVTLFSKDPAWTWYLVAAIIALSLTLAAVMILKFITRRQREQPVRLYDTIMPDEV